MRKHDNQNHICCVNMGEYMVLGSIVCSDYYGMVWHAPPYYPQVHIGFSPLESGLCFLFLTMHTVVVPL